MNDLTTYQIVVRGQVTEDDLQAYSPPGLRLEPAGEMDTLLTFCTDQAALVGLIRRLHGLGLTLLSVSCIEQKSPETFSSHPA